NNVVAIKGVTSINASPSYLGDSITNFMVTPSFPSGINFSASTGLISGIPSVILAQTVFTINGSNAVGSTSTTFTLTVNGGTSIDETEMLDTHIYPNPSNGILKISSSQNIECIEVFDMMGKTRFIKRFEIKEDVHELDLSHLANDIYIMYQASGNGNRSISKFVISK
ncbi:MAG: T9SS type A sorting domain-containing protein, partial [Bacteroidota bacterium]